MFWGFAIRSAGYAFPPLGVPADFLLIAGICEYASFIVYSIAPDMPVLR